jgi:hypothetical protein
MGDDAVPAEPKYMKRKVKSGAIELDKEQHSSTLILTTHAALAHGWAVGNST